MLLVALLPAVLSRTGFTTNWARLGTYNVVLFVTLEQASLRQGCHCMGFGRQRTMCVPQQAGAVVAGMQAWDFWQHAATMIDTEPQMRCRSRR